ncbi:MAG: D-tyrosyl-tRNA(Tyr) deacylase [Flavobacteriales bacterium]|nr:D-tyrosyl-tRNA(Tyr) deacylase [Flavobacteriales bacterium]
MRAVVQRVKRASVTADGVITASIGVGLMVLAGIVEEDTQSDADWLAGKIVRMRIFDDEAGVMNRSVADVGGDVTIVSQFTLHALTARGNRPSYIRAARRDVAIPLYEYFLKAVEKELGKDVSAGIFGADMQVELINDGPVTIIIDSQNRE